MTDPTPPTAPPPEGLTLQVPSEDFPAAPSFALTVPPSWRPEPTTDAALLAYDTSSPAHFRTNVLVTVDRVRGDADLTDAVIRLAQVALGSYPDYRVLADHGAPVGGQPARLRLHSFTPQPGATAVFQLQALVFAPAPAGAPVLDLVQLHATCSGELAGHYAPDFEDLVASFVFA